MKIDIVDVVNRLISFAVPGVDQSADFPLNYGGISISADKLQAFYSGVSELSFANKLFMNAYTGDAFQNEVMKLIAPYVHNRNSFKTHKVAALLKTLSDLPRTERDVYRPLYGVTRIALAGRVALGRFTIYNTRTDLTQLNEALYGRLHLLQINMESHYQIHIRVEARSDAEANEIADQMFEAFERTIRFIMGSYQLYNVGIFHCTESVNRQFIVMHPSGGRASKYEPPTIPLLAIDSPILSSAENGFDKIWTVLGSTSNTDLTKRILLAVSWIGQSIAEKASSSSLVMAAIALEVLFSPKQTETSPSISSQISMSVAMLIGTDSDSRVVRAAEFKRLYGIRSRVVHGGNANVTKMDVDAIQEMARSVIIKMLTSPLLNDVSSGDQMQRLFQGMNDNSPGF
jgi:hypothetical protein